MVSKRVMVGSIITILLCVALGVTCAIIRKFDVVSVILLGVIIALSIAVSVTTWREAVNQKQENK